jgi:hypothetical protein
LKDKAGSDTEPPKPGVRVRKIVSKTDPDTGERKDFDADAKELTVDITKRDYAVQLKRNIWQDEDDDGELTFYGPELLDLLRRLLKHYPYHLFVGETVVLDSPYSPIIIHWDILTEEANKEGEDEKDTIARADLKRLLESLLQWTGDEKLDRYLKNRDSLRKARSITFDALWTVFAPGTVVVGRPFLKKDQIFIIEGFFELWPNQSRRRGNRRVKFWTFAAYTYDWDGTQFQRRTLHLEIEEFDGPKPLESLPYHPLEDDPNKEEIQERLMKRGKLFRRYCTAKEEGRMYLYHGAALFTGGGFRSNADEVGDLPMHRQQTTRILKVCA